MIKHNIIHAGSITAPTAKEGETIEMKVERIVNNKEPITDGAPIIYTERKDGVLLQTDVRTDRFEVALEAMDKVTASKLAARDKKESDKNAVAEKDAAAAATTGTETIQGTEPPKAA